MTTRPGKDKLQRPRGFIAPVNEVVARAVKAIDEKRFSEALKHLATISEESPLAMMWKCYLAGQIYLERGDSDRALHELRIASDVALAPDIEDTSMLRLRASALQKLGDLFRRQECIDEATQAHGAAYELRQAHGSHDECWESGMSLALDSCIARRYEDSLGWLGRTRNDAPLTERPNLAQAIVNGQFAVVLSELHRDEEALAAAREAFAQRKLADPGDVEVALAEMRVGQLLLRCAQNLNTSEEMSGQRIREVISALQHAGDELRAFGDGYLGQIRACDEQIDFAQRLLQGN